MLINGKEEKISFVIPYVDNTDIVWLEIYNNFCKEHKLFNKVLDINTVRYKDNLKLIDYQLRLINKYMPWVDNIYLLLMNREQAPKDLPSNVKIIYHGSFIPQKYLPTFNSTTIEMFLWNIKCLGEYFIYANDDMLPLKPMKPSDFFTEEGKVKVNWLEDNIVNFANTFRLQCLNSYEHIALRLRKKFESGYYKRPDHSFTPMIKSHCKQAYDLISDLITKHIRAFRTEYQYNQYIYPIFEDLVYGTEQSDIDFIYTELQNQLDIDHQIVCFNIIPKSKVEELQKELEERL